LVYEATFRFGDLINYLASSNAGTILNSSKEDMVQACNIVLAHNLKTVRRSHNLSNRHYDSAAFNPERFDLGSGLDAIRGYFISTRAATGRLLVSVQIKSSPSFRKGPLANFMSAVGTVNKARFNKALERVCVSVTHIVRLNAAGQQSRCMKTIWPCQPQRWQEAGSSTNRASIRQRSEECAILR
jgi:eukaryotic translation initiation factor 2C